MATKEILVPSRVRHLPRSDWSWLDRRFLRQYASQLSGDAVFLYLFPAGTTTTSLGSARRVQMAACRDGPLGADDERGQACPQIGPQRLDGLHAGEARPITRISAPAAMADLGVATRFWS